MTDFTRKGNYDWSRLDEYYRLTRQLWPQVNEMNTLFIFVKESGMQWTLTRGYDGKERFEKLSGEYPKQVARPVKQSNGIEACYCDLIDTIVIVDAELAGFVGTKREQRQPHAKLN